MNLRRFLMWGGGLALAVLIVLSAAQSAAGLQGEPPATEEGSMLVEPAMTSPNYKVPWDVIGGGGGTSSSASFRLRQTIGQTAFGTMTSAHYKLHAGFWQIFLNKVFLPYIHR